MIRLTFTLFMLSGWAMMSISMAVMFMAMAVVVMVMTACETNAHKHEQGGECFHNCLSLRFDESGMNDITFTGVR